MHRNTQRSQATTPIMILSIEPMKAIRKTRPNTLTNTIRIRVTKEQHEALMNLAHDRHLTFSDYARKMLLNNIEKTHV